MAHPDPEIRAQFEQDRATLRARIPRNDMANGRNGSLGQWLKDSRTVVMLLAGLGGAGAATGVWKWVAPGVALTPRVAAVQAEVVLMQQDDDRRDNTIRELTWGMRWLICRREFDDSLRVGGVDPSAGPRPTGCEWIKPQAPGLFVR